MGFTVTTSQQFHVDSCCSCGTMFAMTQEFYKRRHENCGPNNPFYCPNGHKQWYVGESAEQKLEKERRRFEEQLEAKNATINRVRMQADAAERRARAANGQVTKLKRRVGNGVCPCCNRTFTDLQRHMHDKHPEFKAEEVAA